MPAKIRARAKVKVKSTKSQRARGVGTATPKRTWVLVANVTSAKIFSVSRGMRDRRKCELLYEIAHPAGKLKKSALRSDRPGRTYSASPGNRRHALEQHQDPHEHEMVVFASSIAKDLQRKAQAGKFDVLMVCAEPRFLGKLRAQFSKTVNNRIVKTYRKDLTKLRPAELRARLQQQIEL